MIDNALKDCQIEFRREYRFDKASRIDYLTVSGIGIEVKKGKPNNTILLKQVNKYCQHDDIHALIIVTPWKRHLHIPDCINDKPIKILSLNQLWGVAI